MRYSQSDAERIQALERDPNFPPEKYRTPWRRDYARLIHSPSFRRLQGKTQLFPGMETDFFRNRLTHSLEVAQIAKSIVIKLNHDLKCAAKKYRIEPDIVEFASLAHDLGHPPFGHFGEEVLDKIMIDCGGFEGNAQSLRLIAITEKRHLIQDTTLGIDNAGQDRRVGLNLTTRSIASILKYDKEIPFTKKERGRQTGPIKGYYKTEHDTVATIKKKVCGGKKHAGSFKTIECQIMDIADDIAYSTYDLEDSFKAEFIKPIDLLCASDAVCEKVARIVNKKIVGINISKETVHERIRKIFFEQFELPDDIEELFAKPSREDLEELHLFSIEMANRLSNNIARDAYFRTNFTSKLVGVAIRKVTIDEINEGIPALSKVKMERDKETDVEILKNIVYESQILSPKIRIIALRSEEIVETIFDALSQKDGYMLLPDDFRKIFQSFKKTEDKKRLICDFIAGMTDRYALEFYGRLTSENPQTIFKPF